MPNTTTTLAPGTWALLTASSTTSARLISVGKSFDIVWIMAGTSTTLPTNFNGAIPYSPQSGLSSEVGVSTLWPSLGTSLYLFGYSKLGEDISLDYL